MNVCEACNSALCLVKLYNLFFAQLDTGGSFSEDSGVSITKLINSL